MTDLMSPREDEILKWMVNGETGDVDTLRRTVRVLGESYIAFIKSREEVTNSVREMGAAITELAKADAQMYAQGYNDGLVEKRRDTILCVCCGNPMGPSAPHNEVRCWECRRDHPIR